MGRKWRDGIWVDKLIDYLFTYPKKRYTEISVGNQVDVSNVGMGMGDGFMA